MSTPSFAVVPAGQVREVLDGRHQEVVGIIEAAYRAHGAGATINPPSYFLRFPDRPTARIIALPASIPGVDGIKWISSFPENTATGLPRASAVLILNDPTTGFPLACMESSIISATRTAASAALAAGVLSTTGRRSGRVGFVGGGLIARTIHDYLAGTGWQFDEIGVYDLSPEYAANFARHLESTEATVTVHDTAEKLVTSSEIIVFATTAGQPYVHEPAWFAHNPLVLHVSLRDLAPEVILSAANYVDDVDHCLRAGTSPHLTEQRTGNRDFVDGTLDDVLAGRTRPPTDRPVIFSPFGLGVLDLALGRHVHDVLRDSGRLTAIDGFFPQ